MGVKFRIPMEASRVTKDQLYAVCDVFCRAGYKTWVSEGEVKNRKRTRYINIESVDEAECIREEDDE